ncbi:MAG: FAD-binding oxidoreductase [Ilumatobacteraceae bacterium]
MTSLTPVPPIELTGTGEHLNGDRVVVDEATLTALAEVCDVTTVTADRRAVAEASRDWWPLALHWSLRGSVPAVAAAVAHPTTVEQVSAVVAICNRERIPVTVIGGRSGVCGGSIPVHGGVLLDMTGIVGVIGVDEASGLVEVAAGTFGPDLEAALRADHALTVGHHPQSFDISTVGGWVACRGAGQYSTRYGKIEDMVAGLEAVLADGTVIRTGPQPAGAVGPDIDQLIIGSEGTLAVITAVTLRAHPVPDCDARATYRFADLATAFEACRQCIRSGATPAVFRLYDPVESARSHGGDGTECVLLVLDEGHPKLVAATLEIVDEVVRSCGGDRHPEDRVAHWLEHRNDTSALQALTRRGYLVDTMEVSAPWSRLGAVYAAVTDAALAVEGVIGASAHLSHSYLDGACLYFSLAARPGLDAPLDEIDALHRAMWDAAQSAALDAGANLSHHHGVGLNRSRFMNRAAGSASGVLSAVKGTLDPQGILNPGKLGVPDPFGDAGW